MIKSENMIPKVYMQSWDMRTLCRIFDLEFDVLKYYTERILDCYSPEHCPENLLPELAAHIGFEYQTLKSQMYNRVVLKNFIRNLIRYRGSMTGIQNAAAIDIRYREVYPDRRYDIETETWVPDPKAGSQIPMSYYEALPAERAWIDVDNEAGIIYLFLVSDSFYSDIDSESESSHDDKMRRLLDLAYLQEYVRPVGMYLLPIVAEKVKVETDLTVRAVRITEQEKIGNNGVTGTPKTSQQSPYDRIHFARTEDGSLSEEPWIRTLYHSQLAGRLNDTYFTAPVYFIQGKFLYYNHDELQNIYSKYAATPPKLGDSLYNPNLPDLPYPDQGYNYGPNPENEPQSLQEQGLTVRDLQPLDYDDHGVFDGVTRYVERGIELVDDIPITGETIDGTKVDNAYPAYLSGDQEDPTTPESDKPSTNKNLMVNLFSVDSETDRNSVQGIEDIIVTGKQPNDPKDICYDPDLNNDMSGDDVYYTFHDDQDPSIP